MFATDASRHAVLLVVVSVGVSRVHSRESETFLAACGPTLHAADRDGYWQEERESCIEWASAMEVEKAFEVTLVCFDATLTQFELVCQQELQRRSSLLSVSLVRSWQDGKAQERETADAGGHAR
jgi:hypothetical protein